jgi:hypothetical protein
MIGSPSVIAGLDPAIHLAESFPKTAPKRITAVDNAMTPA